MPFYTKRIDPWLLTYDEALQCGQVNALAYANQELSCYISDISPIQWRARKGPEKEAVQGIMPLARLLARLVQAQSVMPGSDIYVVIDQDTEQIVGVTTWEYPHYMVPALEQDLGRVGWRWWWHRWYVKVSAWVDDIWVRKGALPHPFINQRMLEFTQHVHGWCCRDMFMEKDVGIMSYADICHKAYPLNMMPYCHSFAILPSYQRQGLGQQLLDAVLDTIPATPCQIHGVQLPQKLHLDAGKEAVQLYRKAGFTNERQFVYEDDGYSILVSHMVLTRQ